MEFDEKIMESKLSQVKDKIDEAILSNPVFDTVFERSCRAATGMTGQNSYRVNVSEDGKTITIVAEGQNLVTREELKNNRSISASIISLEGDALTVTCASGTLYRAEDYRKIGGEISSEFSGNLSTYYTHNIYDDKGIELSYSWYGDSYNLTGGYDYINLSDQVMHYHKPEFTYNLTPQNPMFYANASCGCTYRTYDNLGVSYQTRAEKIIPSRGAEKITASMFSMNTEWPERLTIVPYPIATWSNEERNYIVDSLHEGKTVDEVREYYKESFQKGIENSRTKECDPEMYQNLLEATAYSRSK